MGLTGIPKRVRIPALADEPGALPHLQAGRNIAMHARIAIHRGTYDVAFRLSFHLALRVPVTQDIVVASQSL